MTSSAVVGSSAIRSAGSHDSAIAIMTRWHMPPLNVCGYSFARASGVGMLDPVEHLDRALPCVLARDTPMWRRTVSAICSPTVKAGSRRADRLLEDHGHACAPDLGQLALGQADEVATVEVGVAGDAAPLRRIRPSMASA